MSKTLTDLLASDEIEEIARATKFVQRESAKITGSMFLETILFTKFNQSELSLNELSNQFEDFHNIEISKQGVDQRFTEASVRFMKIVLEKVLNQLLSEQSITDFLKDFRSVRIKDSTAFQLPENMVEVFYGSGGSASKAQIRIQFEFDLRTGKVYDLSLHPFNSQDATDAKNTMPSVIENDFLMRDLAYISIKVLQEIDSKGAFFLNRFDFNSNAYEKKNEDYEQVDFAKIQKRMNKNNIDLIEKEVYLGAKKSIKVRMIITRLPKEEIKIRLKNKIKEAKKKGRVLSDRTKAHIGLSVYIANVSKEKLPTAKVFSLYRLRWQVELIFKVWKSVGEINKVKKMKVERFETMLYAKLLWITINWEIFWELSKLIRQERNIILSPIKMFRTLKNRFEKFHTAFRTGKKAIAEFITKIYNISPKKHRLEEKNNKESSWKIMQLFM